MPAVHRNGDSRSCSATTIVSGQNTVTVNGQLWAVENDQNTHGAGNLISIIGNNITINNKKVIVIGDISIPDLAGHSPSFPTGSSPNVTAYG